MYDDYSRVLTTTLLDSSVAHPYFDDFATRLGVKLGEEILCNCILLDIDLKL